MPTKFSRRMAEKSVTITSRRLDRSFGIFFGRFISSFRISVIVRETKIGIVWLQAVSAREKEDFGNRSPFETTADAGAGIPPNTEGFAAFALMFLHPVTWLITWCAVEGDGPVSKSTIHWERAWNSSARSSGQDLGTIH